jgi:hypothetical protein
MSTREHWTEANQKYLMAALALVCDALTRHAAQAAQAPAHFGAEQAFREAAQAMPAPPALEALCNAFALSPFERDVVLLCAGIELDSTFPALCGAAQGNAQRPYPTFSLALAALANPHWSAITPAAPLRRWRLIEIGAGETLTTSPLKIDERVLHYLTGISYLDERLQGLIERVPAPQALAPSHRQLGQRVAELWSRSQPIIHLGGSDHAGKRAVAAAGCAALRLQLRVLQAGSLPAHLSEREALVRLWEREAALDPSALLIEADETEKPNGILLDRFRGLLLVTGAEPPRLMQREVVHLEVDRPSAAEQRGLWQEAFGPIARKLDGALDRVVTQFDLSAEEIRAATSQVLSNGRDHGATLELWDICRNQARTRLADLAQRIDPVAEWRDLVLPPTQLQSLREIAAQVRHRARVYETWGFASKGTRGLGISALFAGASGTGKTMAAEVLARELRLDLYRIDLSQVVSKYIGETEKNLKRVFDAAEASGAVLLFDEADALFGKRSEVKDSHDRYANVEVSYLLQRMESYRGLAILTTNLKNVLDPAFLRRLRFIVQFPFPDRDSRAEIWARIFPAQTPLDKVDFAKLARLNVTGGNIRNVALHAAFLAAEADEPVRMHHLLRAARSEYAKLEKQMSESETRDWG